MTNITYSHMSMIEYLPNNTIAVGRLFNFYFKIIIIKNILII